MIIGSSREHHEKVSSTNAVAAAKIRSEKPTEGLLITASFQECGRGQQGNTWDSEAGKNLLMSTIIYPSMVNPENQFIISQMTSVAIFDLVRHETPEVKIKWPNDIYVRDDKIAGILIENSLMGNVIQSSILGIGLNLNQKNFSMKLPNAISLAEVTGRIYDVEKIISDLARLLDKRYSMIRNHDVSELAGDYHRALYRCNEWHRYSDEKGEFKGMIDRVMDNGMLVVRRSDGSAKEYAFKEIEYIF